MDRKVILLGRVDGNALGQLRSLGEAGYHPILIWCRKELPLIIKHSKYLGEFFCFENVENAITFMTKKFGNEKNKPILTTDSDGIVMALDHRYDELSRNFFFFNAGSQDRLTFFMQKQELCNLSEKHGLLTPKTKVVKVGEMLSDINYPIITKAINSQNAGWKKEVFICNDKNDLLKAYDNIKSEYILIQEYIKKKNEYILQGLVIGGGSFYTNSRTILSITRRCLWNISIF